MSDPAAARDGRRRRRVHTPEPPSSWSDRLRALKYVPPLLKMVYRAHPKYTVSTLFFRLVQALVPVALLWVGKLIIEAGMRFNAGHALNYLNVKPIAALTGLRELHIGHAIVSRAIFVGLRGAVAEMKQLITQPQAGRS